ncbi:hypothetical protein I4U23_023208 [Adineta vaga]|nr:hypothetical protein I4U23_023208 [Adineta vaga]
MCYQNFFRFNKRSWQESKAMISLIIYCLSGTFLTLFNKLTIIRFPYTNILLILQNTFAVILLIFCSQCFRSTFGSLPRLNRMVFQVWLPLVILFVLMLISSLIALIYVSVPTVIVMRNLTTLFVSLLEYLFLKHKTTRFSLVILIGMLCAAILYAKHDFTFNIRGYIWLGVNILSTSIYQIYIKKIIHLVYFENIGSIGMSYYNNLLSLPLLWIIACGTGEFKRLIMDSNYEMISILLIIISSILGFLLSISAFTLNKLISATSMMVANNVNKFSVILLSELFIKSTLDLVASIGAISVLCLGWLYSQTTKSTLKTICLIITILLMILGAIIEYKYTKTTEDYYSQFQPIIFNKTILRRSLNTQQGNEIYQSYLPISKKSYHISHPKIDIRHVQNYSLPQNCRNRNASIWKTCDIRSCQPYTRLPKWNYPQQTILQEKTDEFIHHLLEIAWGRNPPWIDLYLRSSCNGIMEMQYLLESIKLFWPRFLGSIIIVLDVNDEKILKYILPNQPTHHYIISFEHTPCLPGRIFNQYSYLNLDRHSHADYILTVDSDCIFHSPVTPDLIFRDGKIILSSSQTFQRDLWLKPLEAIMGLGMYERHYMVTQPVTFARSTFSSFRKWFCQTKGQCYEDQLTQLLPKYYQEFCWMCQLGTYLERGHVEKSEYDTYWYQHLDDPSLKPILRYAIHIPYEPFNTTQCREVLCYEKTANEIIKQGLCRAFGPSIFQFCMNYKHFNYINNVTFSYAQFEIQAAEKSERINVLNDYLKRLANVTMMAYDFKNVGQC